jgi:hypothetical protein
MSGPSEIMDYVCTALHSGSAVQMRQRQQPLPRRRRRRLPMLFLVDWPLCRCRALLDSAAGLVVVVVDARHR